MSAASSVRRSASARLRGWSGVGAITARGIKKASRRRGPGPLAITSVRVGMRTGKRLVDTGDYLLGECGMSARRIVARRIDPEGCLVAPVGGGGGAVRDRGLEDQIVV